MFLQGVIANTAQIPPNITTKVLKPGATISLNRPYSHTVISSTTAAKNAIQWNFKKHSFIKAALAKIIKRHISDGRPQAYHPTIGKGSSGLQCGTHIFSEVTTRMNGKVQIIEW